MQKAKVYLVGAGPGDPELLTLRAARLLQTADVVIYDRLVSSEILSLIRPAAIRINGGKVFGQQELAQARIFQAFLDYGGRFPQIVRLKGGDPMVFGRGGEELEFLVSHGFEVEIVPGVSSATAAPGLAGIPLTHRGVASSFAVLAGHRQGVCEIDWRTYANVDTLVVLMGVELRDVIAGSLIAAGRPASHPVAFLSKASSVHARCVESTLGEVARGRCQTESPAVMIIGEVVHMRRTQASAVRMEAVA